MSDTVKKTFIQFKGKFLDASDSFTQVFPKEPGAVSFADKAAALAKVAQLGLSEAQVRLTKSAVPASE